MPNNFRHIGLIHLILPRAKIIDARREPMACCFSNFQQLFAEGQEFSYDLEDVGRYYRDYVRLMAHWDAVLPGRVYRLQHEACSTTSRASCGVSSTTSSCPSRRPACATGRVIGPCARRRRNRCANPCIAMPWTSGRITRPWLQPLREALGDDLL
jgi:hypothetical protein